MPHRQPTSGLPAVRKFIRRAVMDYPTPRECILAFTLAGAISGLVAMYGGLSQCWSQI